MRSHIPLNRFLRAAAIALIAALAVFALSGPPSLVHAAHEPTALTITAGSGKLTAAWTAPTDLGTNTVQDYRYQYKKKADATWSAEAAVTTTSVEISGLDNGVRYEVRVRTRYRAQGSNTDLYSDYVTAEKTPGSAPGAVTGVKVVSGDGTLTITWGLVSAVPPVSSYAVRYRQKDSNTWVDVSDPGNFIANGTTLTTNDTSHGSGGDPLDLGEITHASLTNAGLSFPPGIRGRQRRRVPPGRRHQEHELPGPYHPVQ